MHTFYFKPTQGYGFQVVGIKTTKLPWNPTLGSRMAALDIISLVDAGHTVVIYPEKRTKDSNPDLPRELHLTPEYEAKIKAKKAPQVPATPPELEPFFQFLESTPREWRQSYNGIVRKNSDSVFHVYITEFPNKTTKAFRQAVFDATWKYKKHNPAIRARIFKACGVEETAAKVAFA